MELTVGTLNERTRDDWIENQLKSIRAGASIIDVGAGEQKYRPFCDHLSYTSQDFSQYTGQGNGAGLQMWNWNYKNIDIVSDATDIPVDNETFDTVLCSEVLEHVPNPVFVINEIHRILKIHGRLILTAPFASLTHFAPYHFSTGFNIYWYRDHFENIGFDMIEEDHNGNYFEYLAQELRRLPYISNKYINDGPTQEEWNAVAYIVNMLQRFSDKDKQSFELLNFGYHIIAERIK